MRGTGLIALAVALLGSAAAAPAQETRPGTPVRLDLLEERSVPYLEFSPAETIALQGDTVVALLDFFGARLVLCPVGSTRCRSVGREGGGPGEFRHPSDLSIGPQGDIWVVDNGLTRLSRFGPGGHYVEGYELPGPTHGVVAVEGGAYIDWMRSYFGDPEPTVGRTVAGTGEIRPLFTLEEAVPELLRSPSGAPTHRYWRPMAATADGDSLFIGGRFHYRITVLDPQGGRLTTFGRDSELQRYSEAEATRMYEESLDLFRRAGASTDILEKSLEPRTGEAKPFLVGSGLVMDPAGGVWAVTRFGTADGTNRIDYFPPGGAPVQELVVGGDVQAIAVSEDFLVALVRRRGPEAYDRHGIDVYRIRRTVR